MSELSKNKKLKKLYDFGDRITPQKWAKAVDILVPEDGSDDSTSYLDIPFDQYTTVKTTYEDARTLYESGGMKKGVFYKFEYNLNKEFGFWYIENTFDINVYMNRHGDLKCKGSYTVADTSKEFIADYSFAPAYVNVHAPEYPVFAIFGDHTFIFNVASGHAFEDILSSLNIDYNFKYDEDIEILTYVLRDVAVITYSDYNDDVEKDVLYIAIVTRSNNSVKFVLSDSEICFEEYNIGTSFPKGYIYNLDFKTHQHSHIIDGNLGDYEGNGPEYILVNASVYNNLSEYILISDANDELKIVITSGTIRNSIVEACGEVKEIDVEHTAFYSCHFQNNSNTIYAKNVVFDSCDFEKSVIIGDLYYGELIRYTDDILNLSDIIEKLATSDEE